MIVQGSVQYFRDIYSPILKDFAEKGIIELDKKGDIVEIDGDWLSDCPGGTAECQGRPG